MQKGPPLNTDMVPPPCETAVPPLFKKPIPREEIDFCLPLDTVKALPSCVKPETLEIVPSPLTTPVASNPAEVIRYAFMVVAGALQLKDKDDTNPAAPFNVLTTAVVSPTPVVVAPVAPHVVATTVPEL